MRFPDQLQLKLDLARVLTGEPVPSSATVHLRPPTASKAAANIDEATRFIRAWENWTPPEEVEWVTRNWSSHGLGHQRVPVYLRIASWDRIASLTGRSGDLERATKRFSDLVARVPDPSFTDAYSQAAARAHSAWLSLSDDDFHRLLLAVTWFHHNPNSGLRARAVPIEGLDTKWVGNHRRLLLRLLQPLGHSGLGLAQNDATVRIRFLDASLAPAPGLADIAVPLNTELDLPHSTSVIIVENKESFLALPQAPEGSHALLVWGAGYSGTALAALSWIQEAASSGKLLYWGDADADGFNILDALRANLDGGITSVAMDPATVERFLHLSVMDPGDHTKHLPRLTDEEDRARRILVASGGRRLEQERVELDWALNRPAFKKIWGSQGPH